MQVFNVYFKIMKKQAPSIIIYAVLFLWLTVMITFNLNSGRDQFETRKVKTMVINQDGQSKLTDGFLEYMEQYVTFVEPEKKEEAAKDALYYGQVTYILTIPEGFSRDFMETGEAALQKLTTPDSTDAITVDSAINNYFNIARVYLKHIPNMDQEQLSAYVKQNLDKDTPVVFNVAVKDTVSAANTYNQSYYNYLGYILIASFITGVSLVLYSFHGLDIRRKHEAAPITSRNMNLQLIIANIIFVMSYLLLFIVAGFLLNKNRIMNINTVLYWINAVVFALVALSISYLVGISVNSKKAIAAISTALSLSLAFLSGMFVPQEYLGKAVLKVASFTPSYWYVRANNTIVSLTSSTWSDISEIAIYMAIQLGFAAAIISVALVVSKRKRQQAY